MQLNLRSQMLDSDEAGRSIWRSITTPVELSEDESALLICDMWDNHWSMGAARRVNEMVLPMNAIVKAARNRGILIIHSPSDVIDFYKDSKARRRVLEAPKAELPPPREHADYPLPVDDSDGGSDTGEASWYTAWTRQHPGLDIDEESDIISADGEEILNFLAYRGIRNLLMMGVHTNMCVLHRPFGIKQMVRRGVNVILVRDLTDTMYNPARSPYVSHDEGTRLVVEYIEKFWCPTVSSSEILK